MKKSIEELAQVISAQERNLRYRTALAYLGYGYSIGLFLLACLLALSHKGVAFQAVHEFIKDKLSVGTNVEAESSLEESTLPSRAETPPMDLGLINSSESNLTRR